MIGASNSAVDAALEIYRKGGDVTMIIRSKEIGSRVKYWVRPDILNRIREGEIKVFFNSALTEIKEDEVIINSLGKTIAIKNDYVLALTGYKPNFDFIRKLGVKISNDEKKRPQYNDETMETNVEGIYLAGVVCGGMETHKWFIENSRIHAKLIIRDIKLKNETKK